MKYIALKPITNDAGFGIKTVNDEEVTFDFVTSDKVLSCHKAKLYQNTKGWFYFKYGNLRYYLNEFIRTDFP